MAMKYALDNGYRTLIAPQDDQKVTDPNLVANIERLLNYAGDDNIGCIGLRDGFNDLSYKEMASSEWSESTFPGQVRLPNGAFMPRRLINDGGIVYPTTTIKKAGYNDVERYKRFYIECDYAARCHAAGLRNYVMGNSLIHRNAHAEATFGSTHYLDPKIGENDLKTYQRKWKS